MTKIACIVDSRNKVHEQRIGILKNLLSEFCFYIFTPHVFREPEKYDVVYYMSYSLYNNLPIKHDNIVASITSHKALDEFGKTVKTIRNFKKVSVNNQILFNKFSRTVNVVLIPNGVDVNAFCPPNKKLYDPENIKIGWVGNVDRATKNFNTIVKVIKNKKIPRINVITIETSKSRPYKFSQPDMVKFYHGIDFYLVASSTEGTPNPALEAAACGVPVISGFVGNVPELITDQKNGFLVKSINVKSFLSILKNKIYNITQEKYGEMSKDIHLEVLKNWDWRNRVEKYRGFFAHAG